MSFKPAEAIRGKAEGVAMKIRKEESGQVLVLTALTMVLMLGFVGLAVDVGMLFHARRNMQIAADAAAIAGAVDYHIYGDASRAHSAALSAAAENGIEDLSNVTVNVPPQSGPNVSSPGFVEAIVNVPHFTVFMSLFGFRTVNVSARGVAGTPGPPDACVYVLDPKAPAAMDLQGSFTINAPECGVVVNSKDSDALQFTGGAGTLKAKWVSVVGGDGGHSSDSNPAPVTGAAPVSDPLGGLMGPTLDNGGCAGGDGFPGESGSTYSTTPKTVTLTGDLTTSAPGAGKALCFTQPVTLQNVTLGPGIYVFGNGVTLSGNISAIGVTLDVANGGVTIPTGGVNFGTAGNDATGLVAPTTGETAGVALMEPPGNNSMIQIQKGNATGNISGIIYAPSAELYLQDSGGDKSGGISFYADIIVGTLFDKTATMQINGYSGGGASRLKAISLVE